MAQTAEGLIRTRTGDGFLNLKTTIIHVVLTVPLLLTACGKKADRPAVAASAVTPILQAPLTAWKAGDKSTALSTLIATDWDNGRLFASNSTLSLSEDQFKALSDADRQAQSGEIQAATHRTSGSAAVAAKELRVEIKWPGSKRAIEVPLELVNELPVVRCRLNGKEAVLYVDTGSHALSLYEDRLARFGLKVTSEEDWPQYTTGGLVTRTRFCNEFLLAFEDGLNLEVSGAACLPAAGRSPGHDVDGLLGVKIMRALNGVIDLGASKMTFTVKVAPKSGPANSSPPIGSETNRTSSPVGPRR